MVTIVAIDCASRLPNMGFCVGTWEAGKLSLIEETVLVGEEEKNLNPGEHDKELFAAFLNKKDTPILKALEGQENVLFALDAPLGWPLAMQQAFANGHAPGEVFASDKDRMFSRESDRMIQERFLKKPLEVGADRIARAGHSALRMLQTFRELCGKEIEMAWEPGKVRGWQAIEVYPAATFWVYDPADPPTKKQKAHQGRRKKETSKIEEVLINEGVDITPFTQAGNDHVWDAGLCLLAGRDFASGRSDVIRPGGEQLEIVKAESWIWTRPPFWKIYE